MGYQPAAKDKLADFRHLNPWYYADASKRVQPMLDSVRRQFTFDEVQGGLDAGTAACARPSARAARSQ